MQRVVALFRFSSQIESFSATSSRAVEKTVALPELRFQCQNILNRSLFFLHVTYLFTEIRILAKYFARPL